MNRHCQGFKGPSRCVLVHNIQLAAGPPISSLMRTLFRADYSACVLTCHADTPECCWQAQARA